MICEQQHKRELRIQWKKEIYSHIYKGKVNIILSFFVLAGEHSIYLIYKCWISKCRYFLCMTTTYERKRWLQNKVKQVTCSEKKKQRQPFSYRGPEQQCVCVPQRGVCAGALDAPLRQPVQQQQQETPRAHGTYTHQDHLPQTGLVPPHLLHGRTLMLAHWRVGRIHCSVACCWGKICKKVWI